MLERDRFCRWCGQCQGGIESLPDDRGFDKAATTVSAGGPTSPYTTSGLWAAPAKPDFYRPVSGPLVQAALANISTSPVADFTSRVTRRLIFILISIPVWLIIVLLSPLDAYLAARALSKE
ncbi:MAG TPA: hypothetical protein VJQ56_11690 [Blastocatellia bacterium]|nr:hypothetical protein [Blastocatellia bacterium]